MDRGTLAGVVPLVLEPGVAGGGRRLRLLGAGTSTGGAPLALAGCENPVAAAAARALAAHPDRADAIAFEALPADSPWPLLLARHWPGARPGMLHQRSRSPEPFVHPGGFADYDAWLAARSTHFRKRLRRVWRKLDERGVTARRTGTLEALPADLAAFVRLHHARWAHRGGSGVLTPGVEAMLLDAAPRLLAEGRLDLWSLEADGEVICSQLYLSGGTTTTWWLQGYDDAWADAELTIACLARVIEDGFARGRTLLSLGEGGQDYKRRLSDGEAMLAWSTLALPGPRLPLVVGEAAGRRVAKAALARVGPERAAWVRSRLPGG